jgi:hypothetical protein
VESRTKGTMILHYKGQFLKVITARSSGDNDWTLQCRDLDIKQDQTLTLNLSGFLEALEKALPAMKNPKDIFFLDLDNKGQWKIVTKEQTARL